MKKIIIILILVSAFILNAELNDVFKQVIEYYNGINTFQAELHQENYWHEIDLTKTSEGMIYFDSDSLFVNYLEPDKQQLYVLGDAIIMHEPRTAQAVWMDKGDFELKPAEVFKQYWNSEKAALLSNEGTQKTIAIEDETEIIEIELDNYFIRTLKIMDSEGNSVKYTFRNECINCPLPEAIFQVNIPATTNIIDNRNKGE